MSPRSALFFIAGLTVGLIAGRVLLAARFPAAASAPPAAVVVAAADSAGLPSTSAESRSPSAVGRDTSGAPAGTVSDGYRLWETLALRGPPSGNETNWFKLPDMTGMEGYGSASPDAPLNPAFAEFFDLTPEERGRVQTLLQTTLRRQREMDVARIGRIESKFRIKTAIGIPDYSTESTLLRQTFDGGLRAILGDARHRVYQDWAAHTFRNDFPGLAGVRREYHIVPARADEPPGSLQVVTVKLAPGQEWKGRHYTTGYATISEAENATQLPLSRYFPVPAQPTTPAPASTP